jgi:alpha-beta hydrolase superfamily lysophospholipase
MRPMSRRLIRIVLILVLFPPLLAAVAGWFVAPTYLHPPRRQLTADLIKEADVSFEQTKSRREDFSVRALDGAVLHGWKVRSPHPNGAWVLLFHGVADNRVGVVSHSEFLLRAGYNVTLMDARAHGDSEGSMATYGWLERGDTSAILDGLVASEHPTHIFALGESMGAGLALQSAGADPRIEAVVAEASFANLMEAGYDYAGLRRSPLLGRTLLAPFAWVLVYRGQSLAGFSANGASPERAVAARPFPVLLICDAADDALPCRHSERIYAAASGPKSLWVVPGAFHTAALGVQPVEFRRRVLDFYANPASIATEGASAVASSPAVSSHTSAAH